MRGHLFASAPHTSARTFLETQSQHGNWQIELEAILARFKTYVRAEGIFRLNHNGTTRTDYDETVRSLVEKLSEREKSIALLAFASAFFDQRIGFCAKAFMVNYVDLQHQIEMRWSSLLADDNEKIADLKKLIAVHDYVGVCVLITLTLTAPNQQVLREALLDGCYNGTITPAPHVEASCNLVSCFLLKNDYRRAFDTISNLASRNPEQVDFQIQAAEILMQIPGEETGVSQKIASIRHAYKLGDADEKRLFEIEQVLATRNA